MKRTNKKTQAFTLIELMVVISIISLLISILLPALTSARQAAQSIKCLSNLRQIGITYAMYGMNSKGYAPNASDQVDGNGQSGLRPGNESALEILMTDYGNGAKQMVYCPTLNIADGTLGQIDPNHAWYFYNSSYGINSIIGVAESNVAHHNATFGFIATSNQWIGVRIDDIQHGSQRLAVADTGDYLWSAGAPNPSSLFLNRTLIRRGAGGAQWGAAVSRRHLNETTNILLVDNHAQNAPMRTVQQPNKQEWAQTGWNYWGGNLN